MPRETRLSELLDQNKAAEVETQIGASIDPEQAEQENAAQQYYGKRASPFIRESLRLK